MKTRIIQTRFWDDEFVCELAPIEKLVFLYLITNQRIGLTGAYECPDKYIAFDVGISTTALEKIKKRLSDKFIFVGGWVVIVNASKYNNYSSNAFQKKAYKKEYEYLPEHIKPYVQEVEAEEYAPDYVKGRRLNYKHREIAEKVLGRALSQEEVVHHIDKNPKNNNINNLAVMPKEIHIKLHKGEIELDNNEIILLSHYYDSGVTPLLNNKQEIRNKNTAKKSSLKALPLTDSEIQELATSLHKTPDKIKTLYEKILDYELSTGKSYKDYKATIRNWLRMEYERRAKHGEEFI